jgi:hypothetical protein
VGAKFIEHQRSALANNKEVEMVNIRRLDNVIFLLYAYMMDVMIGAWFKLRTGFNLVPVVESGFHGAMLHACVGMLKMQ